MVYAEPIPTDRHHKKLLQYVENYVTKDAGGVVGWGLGGGVGGGGWS